MLMKVIIIAAGPAKRLRPLTGTKPKCLLEINGKTILQRQLETFRSFGLNDFVVVKGYEAKKINYPGIKYYLNDDFWNNNILASLFYAEKEMDEDFIFSYSDIIFEKGVVEKLLKEKGDVCIVVDEDWKSYYKGRTDHPITEAENVIIEKGNIIKIGKHLTAEEADGEFIGMIKFSKKGAKILNETYNSLKKQFSGMPFQKANVFENAYMTDMVQELVDRGFKVKAVPIKSGWYEIDTVQDFKKVCEILK